MVSMTIGGTTHAQLSPVSNAATADEISFGTTRTSTTDLPQPVEFAHTICQGIVDASCGRRQVGQIARYLSGSVAHQISRRAHLARRLQQNIRAQNRPQLVRSIHVCEPTDGVAEVSATVAYHDRVRAVALRMEGLDGRWQVTALSIA